MICNVGGDNPIHVSLKACGNDQGIKRKTGRRLARTKEFASATTRDNGCIDSHHFCKNSIHRSIGAPAAKCFSKNWRRRNEEHVAAPKLLEQCYRLGVLVRVCD